MKIVWLGHIIPLLSFFFFIIFLKSMESVAMSHLQPIYDIGNLYLLFFLV